MPVLPADANMLAAPSPHTAMLATAIALLGVSIVVTSEPSPIVWIDVSDKVSQVACVLHVTRLVLLFSD